MAAAHTSYFIDHYIVLLTTKNLFHIDSMSFLRIWPNILFTNSDHQLSQECGKYYFTVCCWAMSVINNCRWTHESVHFPHIENIPRPPTESV